MRRSSRRFGRTARRGGQSLAFVCASLLAAVVLAAPARAAWTGPVDVSGSPATAPQVAIDADGDAVFVWTALGDFRMRVQPHPGQDPLGRRHRGAGVPDLSTSAGGCRTGYSSQVADRRRRGRRLHLDALRTAPNYPHPGAGAGRQRRPEPCARPCRAPARTRTRPRSRSTPTATPWSLGAALNRTTTGIQARAALRRGRDLARSRPSPPPARTRTRPR